MLIKQISIFIPNKKGSLSQLTDILIAHKIDIRAIAVFDRLSSESPELSWTILTGRLKS